MIYWQPRGIQRPAPWAITIHWPTREIVIWCGVYARTYIHWKRPNGKPPIVEFGWVEWVAHGITCLRAPQTCLLMHPNGICVAGKRPDRLSWLLSFIWPAMRRQTRTYA